MNEVRLTFARAAVHRMRRPIGVTRLAPRSTTSASSSSPEVRILYSAIDQTVPGTLGGSVHVQAVAEGLAALGHEVHALVAAATTRGRPGAVQWHDMRAPGGRAQLRLLARRAVARHGPCGRARPGHRALPQLRRRGHAGGARRRRARFVLEVNAPVVDYPGSPKVAAGSALVVQPMRRWRELTGARGRPDRLAKRADPARVGAGRPGARDRVGRRHPALPPGGQRRCRVAPGAGPHDRRGLRRRVSRVARRHAAGRGDPAAARARDRTTFRRC